MTKEEIRIGLSWGLITAAIIHAILLAALCLGARHGIQKSDDCGPQGCQPLPLPRGSITSSIEPEKFAEPPAVNYAAQSELKQQCPGGQCPTPQRVAVSNPYNLAPGERLVPGSVRWSDPKPAQSPVVITPASYPAQAAGQRIPAKSYQVLLFLDNSQQSVALQSWFDRDDELLKLREKSSFQVYTPNNSLYRSRFASVVPVNQFPAVLIQDATGGHIHAAGKSMIPGTSSELVSDIRKGYELYKQAKQGTIQATGAIKSTGYSWDDQINPAMRLSSDNCGPDGCPPPSEDNSRWYPGKNLPLFDTDKAKNPLEALFWGSAFDLATIAVFGAAALLLVFVIARRS
jgi:hypothetical protein